MRDWKPQEKSWYPNAVAASVAVALYVLLTHFGTVWGVVKTFIGYFSVLILGGVLAYVINPLAELYRRRVFSRMKREGLRWTFAVFLAVLTVLLVLAALAGTLVPQLVRSLTTLVGNLEGYSNTLQGLAEKWDLARFIDIAKLANYSETIVERIAGYVMNNLGRIASASAVAGRTAVNWAIALILSVYLLLSKESLKAGALRLLAALMPEKQYAVFTRFISRCNGILTRYVVCSLLDSLIVGSANWIFMTFFLMQYTGLVSVVVAVTNLVPTFGPLVGAAIGAFILLLVKPWHALAFLIFTMLLQFCDGYIIKPKLFGDTLGVPGLLILVAVVVGGNMFGVVGILLAIPCAAILDFLYRDTFLPWLESRREKSDKPEEHTPPTAQP